MDAKQGSTTSEFKTAAAIIGGLTLISVTLAVVTKGQSPLIELGIKGVIALGTAYVGSRGLAKIGGTK